MENIIRTSNNQFEDAVVFDTEDGLHLEMVLPGSQATFNVGIFFLCLVWNPPECSGRQKEGRIWISPECRETPHARARRSSLRLLTWKPSSFPRTPGPTPKRTKQLIKNRLPGK